MPRTVTRTKIKSKTLLHSSKSTRSNYLQTVFSVGVSADSTPFDWVTKPFGVLRLLVNPTTLEYCKPTRKT